MKAPSFHSKVFSVGLITTVLLVIVLGILTLPPLIALWNEDTSLSHSPILCLIALGLLWNSRKELLAQGRPTRKGLVLLIASIITQIVSVWADIAFLKPVSFLGILSGAVGTLFGIRPLKACVSALGLLVFTAPWPTTLVERLSFPLQLSSSSYAALFAGIFGLPIHREGVEIHVMNTQGNAAIYSILVAQKCSGLTSLNVLLALGYLIALLTPIAWWGRTLLVGVVIPLTLFANAIRLTFILIAGAYRGASVAQWIHDHEQPVLIFFCSIGLMGFRTLLMRWTTPTSMEVADETSTDSR